MGEPRAAVRAYTTAVSTPDAATLAALEQVLAEDVVVAEIIGGGSGKAKVLAALAEPAGSRLLAHAAWDEPALHDGGAQVYATLPASGPISGVTLTIAFAAASRITRVEQDLQPAPPPPATPLALTAAIGDALSGALANGTPVIVAFVDAQGQPHLSPRGAAQLFSADQLALWNRDPAGGMTRGIAAHPRVALSYRDPQAHVTYQFAGQARVTTDPAEREHISANSPAIERNLDSRRRGVAVIVELDRVEGMGPADRVHMERH
jgi:hypothetical protein